ncbi:MAG: hypothetical protein K6U11_10210 [bacterium]|nr:hypothetical protein [bacterium]
MGFFKPVLMSMLCGLLVCSILIVCCAAPAGAVIMGGLSAVVFSIGRAIYNYFKNLISQKIGQL